MLQIQSIRKFKYEKLFCKLLENLLRQQEVSRSRKGGGSRFNEYERVKTLNPNLIFK